MEETATSLTSAQPVAEPIPSADSVLSTDAELDCNLSNVAVSTKIEAAASLTSQPSAYFYTEPVSSADSVSNTDAHIGDNPSNDAAKTETPSNAAEAPDSVLQLKRPTVFANPKIKSSSKNVSSVHVFQYKFKDGTLMDYNQKNRFRELLEQKIYYLMINRLLHPKDAHGVPSIQVKEPIKIVPVGAQNSSKDSKDITSVGNGVAHPASESLTSAAGSENTEGSSGLEVKPQSAQELTGLGNVDKVEEPIDAAIPQSRGLLEPVDIVEGEPSKESQEQLPKKSSPKSFRFRRNKEDAKTVYEQAADNEIPESNGPVEPRRRRPLSNKALMIRTVQQTVTWLREKFQQLSPSQQDAITDVNGFLALVGIVDSEKLPKQNKLRTRRRSMIAVEGVENVEDRKPDEVKSGYTVIEGIKRVPWSQLPSTVGTIQLTRNDKNWLRRRLFSDAQYKARMKRREEGTSLGALKESNGGVSQPSAEADGGADNETMDDWGDGLQTQRRRQLIWAYYLKEAQGEHRSGSVPGNDGRSSGGTDRDNVSTSSAAMPAAKKLKMSPAGEFDELCPLIQKLVGNVVKFSQQQQPIEESMENVIESTSVHEGTRTKARNRRGKRARGKKTSLETPFLPGDARHIAVVPRHYPHVRLTSGQAEQIQRALLNYMSGDVGPRFQDSSEERGALVFSCSDPFTVDWLYTAVSRIKPWPSSQLIATPWTGRAEVSVQIPKLLENLSGRALFEKLKTQNREVLTSRWEFQKFHGSGNGQAAVFSVNDETLKALRSVDYQLYLGFVKVDCEVLSEPL